MKFLNQTHWRTDHLKAIIQRVAEDELSPSQRKTMVIHLTYGTRSTDSCGHTLPSGRTGWVKHDGKWTPYKVRVCVSSQRIDRKRKALTPWI